MLEKLETDPQYFKNVNGWILKSCKSEIELQLGMVKHLHLLTPCQKEVANKVESTVGLGCLYFLHS